MAATIGAMVAEAWEWSLALSAYGFKPLTVGWHRHEAFVRIWNFRTGDSEWRRMPSRDGQQPAKPPAFRPFESEFLYRVMR